METYRQFLERTEAFITPELNIGDGDFKANPSLAQKVSAANIFKSFYGDTVVFALDEMFKLRLSAAVDSLYAAAPECFCERLDTHSFHVTLHDLGNSAALKDVAEELFFNELKVVDRKRVIRRLGKTPIRFKSTYIFNMVNTSLVLGLKPSDEKNYNKLIALYSVFDDVKKLDYPLTPHITLAYYNVNGFGARAAESLAAVVNTLNRDIETEIAVGSLFYQKFTDMNSYADVIKLL